MLITTLKEIISQTDLYLVYLVSLSSGSTLFANSRIFIIDVFKCQEVKKTASVNQSAEIIRSKGRSVILLFLRIR